MKKLLILISFLTLSLFCFLLYFFQKIPPENVPGPPVTKHISLYHYFSGSLSGGVDDAIAVINSQSPHVKIITHALDHEAFKTMIVQTLDNGTPPELFTYWAGAKSQELVNNGQLEPLDDIWQENNLDSLLSPVLNVSATTYNDHKYFIPLDQHFVVFFFNKNIFSKLNLSPPKTYSELIEIARTLKSNNITPFALGAIERWPAQFWFDYLLLRTAGPQFRYQLMHGKRTYIDPEVLHVYSIWAELIKMNYFNNNANTIDWAQATDLVCSGDAAMTLMGTWAIQQFIGETCNLEELVDFDYFIFPTVNPDIQNTAVGPVDGIVVSKKSVNSQLAKKLLPYFFEKEVQQAFSAGSGAFATNSKISKDFYSPIKQRLLRDIENADSWAFNFDLATPGMIADLGMDSFNELFEFPNEYQEILQSLHTKASLYFNDIQTKNP